MNLESTLDWAKLTMHARRIVARCRWPGHVGLPESTSVHWPRKEGLVTVTITAVCHPQDRAP
jgi:hypothetical protein